MTGWALPHRSGVTDADVERQLPGDDLILSPRAVLDRGMPLPASVEQVWPWIAQLGKGRGGWYMPRWVDRLTPRARRSLRTIDPRLQSPAVGDDVPDWGPGDPVFRAVTVEEPTTLVYLSLRQRSNRWRWPDDEQAADVLGFSWALVLTPTGPQTSHLHIRLRMKAARKPPRTQLLMVLGGLVDWATIALLERGLAERLRNSGDPAAHSAAG